MQPSFKDLPNKDATRKTDTQPSTQLNDALGALWAMLPARRTRIKSSNEKEGAYGQSALEHEQTSQKR